jgi:hypothetical protein
MVVTVFGGACHVNGQIAGLARRVHRVQMVASVVGVRAPLLAGDAADGARTGGAGLDLTLPVKVVRAGCVEVRELAVVGAVLLASDAANRAGAVCPGLYRSVSSRVEFIRAGDVQADKISIVRTVLSPGDAPYRASAVDPRHSASCSSGSEKTGSESASEPHFVQWVLGVSADKPVGAAFECLVDLNTDEPRMGHCW